MALLDVRDLRIDFPGDPPLLAVDGLSLAVSAGRTTALVGESGCGKSVSALAVLGLLPEPGRVIGGQVLLHDQNLLALPPRARRQLCGRKIGLVSQDPLAALNPVYSVGAQVAEAITAHQRLPRREAWSRAVAALAEVGLPDPPARARAFPHQLSGGQRQRVVIAMAIACQPELLIADEPTTALDVSVQAQVLDLLRRLRDDRQMGLLLITHDLGVVAEMADTVCVMRAGRPVETAPVRQLFAAPSQPYTKALLAAVPRLGARDAELETVHD